MLNPNRIPPVKTSVSQRSASLLLQHEHVRAEKAALVVDPLMKLSQVVELLGNPSYTTLRSWIKSGSLKVWRAGRGHYKIRLSEVKRFLTANEVRTDAS
jgi:excisionase family DNA binding protein